MRVRDTHTKKPLTTDKMNTTQLVQTTNDCLKIIDLITVSLREQGTYKEDLKRVFHNVKPEDFILIEDYIDLMPRPVDELRGMGEPPKINVPKVSPPKKEEEVKPTTNEDENKNDEEDPEDDGLTIEERLKEEKKKDANEDGSSRKSPSEINIDI